jgi:hypothetical protein
VCGFWLKNKLKFLGVEIGLLLQATELFKVLWVEVVLMHWLKNYFKNF